MKIVKRVALAVVILIAIPLVVAIFVPRNFVIEREITIDQPKEVVFDYVKHLKNQESYNKWLMADPQIETSYRGEDGAVGFVMTWESDDTNVGKGEQEITNIVEGERVDVEIRIVEPFQSTDPASTATESVGEGKTKVITTYYGKMIYPTNLLCPFVSDAVGKDMELNLLNLKAVMEKQ